MNENFSFQAEKIINGLSMLPAKRDLSQDQVEGVAVRPILRPQSPKCRGPVPKRCVDWCVTLV